MFRIALCDDDTSFREMLEEWIRQYFIQNPMDYSLAAFSSGSEALMSAERTQYDAAFLDVKIEGTETGIQIAEKFKAAMPDIRIIFVTAYEKFVPRAFRLGAFQFLSKPVEEEEFLTEMDRILADYRQRYTHLEISWKGIKRFVPVNTICYVETDKAHKVLIHTTESIFPAREKLDNVARTLSPFGFLRLHRGILASMRYIRGKKPDQVGVFNGREIVWLPVSRDRRHCVDTAYTAWRRKECVPWS